MTQLSNALQRAVEDGARSIVLTGESPAFCAGLDLGEARRDAQNLAKQFGSILDLIDTLPVPLVAALNGDAVAGGAGLALCADVVIAKRSVRIGFPGIHRGIVPGVIMPRLQHQVGARRARHLIVTGRLLEVEEAREIGLIDEWVESDVRTRAVTVGTQLAAIPGAAMQMARAWLNDAEAGRDVPAIHLDVDRIDD
jgi:methylglutaconyl-CoA hydratase